MKESELAAMLIDKNNISAQLANHQLLLNRSQVRINKDI
jgi:hypothetical protein